MFDPFHPLTLADSTLDALASVFASDDLIDAGWNEIAEGEATDEEIDAALASLPARMAIDSIPSL